MSLEYCLTAHAYVVFRSLCDAAVRPRAWRGELWEPFPFLRGTPGPRGIQREWAERRKALKTRSLSAFAKPYEQAQASLPKLDVAGSSPVARSERNPVNG